jgi:hypothetical protein
MLMGEIFKGQRCHPKVKVRAALKFVRVCASSFFGRIVDFPKEREGEFLFGTSYPNSLSMTSFLLMDKPRN